MGKLQQYKQLTLATLLVLTCILVYSRQSPPHEALKMHLDHFFTKIEGYTNVGLLNLPPQYIRMLKLDDYYFANYEGSTGDSINLYIGYYYTADKAYAAHSPAVCYPSQGWKIRSGPYPKTLKIGSHDIHYMEMISSQGTRKELILFWYQAGQSTNTQVYSNKIDIGYNRLMNRGEHNGFVRIVVPLNSSYKKSKQTVSKFIRAFYPHLLKYMRY